MRGNDRQLIFLDRADRESFLDVLSQVVSRYAVRCHAYCLMGNHYHLLAETERANLSLAMRQLNGVYSRRFNRSYHRVGHVFQTRYRAILVEKERHLLSLSRYVVSNPVRAGLCERPADWPWSSYRAMLGLDERPAFLTTSWLLSQFGRSHKTAAAAYRAYVEGEVQDDPWRELVGGLYLGDEEFVTSHAPGDRLSSEIPFAQQKPLRPPLVEIVAADGETGILTAYRHGYRLHEIARVLHVHPATVSRRLRTMERERMRECKT